MVEASFRANLWGLGKRSTASMTLQGMRKTSDDKLARIVRILLG